jgi:hypothetical protein
MLWQNVVNSDRSSLRDSGSMDEQQRDQRYVDLIEKLLGCPQGQEIALLQANAELLDADLLAVMEQVAADLESQGDGNASWLRGFATQLMQAFGRETAASEEDAAQFLRETLQLVGENKGNPQEIYSVWAQQQAQLNETFMAALPTVAKHWLAGDAEQRTFVASALVDFGNLIQRFPLGNRWLNLELGIAAYQQALTVMTQTAMPVEWATTMNNLATAYSFRIRGDRAENVEAAIAAYQQALTVRTQTVMPVEWAQTMTNLGVAYKNRIRGDRAENIEAVIAAYQQALTVMTKTTIPVGWSLIMNNLALAYSDRIRGDQAENVEAAISTYQQALTVRTQTSLPVEWAQTMMNLAIAYKNRIRGDRAENVEAAIAAYQQALMVRTQTAMPVEWALTMMNLAVAYSDRIRGDRAENLEAAIAVYQQALTVRTQTAMPVEWALTMNNLAGAYSDRIRGDRAENLEVAIVAYQQALTVRTQTAMPVEWAQTMINLATAHQNRVRGDRAENLEAAIATYQQALTVMTQTAMPVEWALTINNLANTYKNRIRGDQAENLEVAIAAYQQALTVRTQTAMPVEWAQTMMNLAIAYKNRIRGDRAENLEVAIAAYQQALTVTTQTAMPVEWAQTMMNLANAYAERIRGDSPEERLRHHAEDIEQAIAAYQSSLTVFDPKLLPDDCRRTARSLGNLYSEQQYWQEAIPIYQKAIQASERLYQSANLLGSKAAELAETADLPRRAAYALARAGHLQTATLTLEQGRARELSETLERDRADLTQLQQTHPNLYDQYQEVTLQLRTLESQQRERMTSDDRYALTPETLRDTALNLRQQLTNVLQNIRQIKGYEQFLALPTFADPQVASPSSLPPTPLNLCG